MLDFVLTDTNMGITVLSPQSPVWRLVGTWGFQQVSLKDKGVCTRDLCFSGD